MGVVGRIREIEDSGRCELMPCDRICLVPAWSPPRNDHLNRDWGSHNENAADLVCASIKRGVSHDFTRHVANTTSAAQMPSEVGPGLVYMILSPHKVCLISGGPRVLSV